MLVGTLAIVQGFGDPPSLSRTLPPFPQNTGPEAKAEELTEPVSPTETVPPSGPSLQPHHLLRDHLHFFPPKKQSKAFIAPFLLTTKLRHIHWECGKEKKAKRK